MPDDPAKKKDELLELLAGVAPEAKKLEALGKEIIQNARLASDTAGPLYDIYSHAPAGEFPTNHWKPQIESWRAWHGSAKAVLDAQTTINSFSAVAQSTSNIAMSGAMSVIPLSTPVISSTAPLSSPLIQQARSRLVQTLERFPLTDEVRSNLRRLGLNFRGGNFQTPLAFLEEARASFDMPVVADGGSVSVLISLRSCIDAAITELVRRRPQQEPVKGWYGKVVSLGQQCGRPGLDGGYFDRLGNEAENEMNRLSGAKQANFERTQLTESFRQGLLFLNSLLESIDERLLRPG